MACKLKTYWIEYSIDYEFYDQLEAKWQKEHWHDADRFKCRKRDIKNEVHKRLHEELFLDGSERNVVITINDCYETTECEV
jgi:hypothetical protein